MHNFPDRQSTRSFSWDHSLIFLAAVGFHPSIESIQDKFYMHFTHVKILLKD